MLLSEEELKIEERRLNNIIKHNCKKCNGKGYILKENDDYQLSEECECIKKIKRNLNLLDWGVPKKFIQDEWEEKLKNKSYYPRVKNYFDNFKENYRNNRGIFFHGPHGRGKTTAECVIAKHVSAMYNEDTLKCFTVAFALFSDIIKMSFDMEKNKLNQFLYKSDLLIIDNIGNENGKNDNRFSQRFLENIIRKRDNDCKPLILSSNYDMKEMKENYGEDVHDFIISNNEIIKILGENHRVENQVVEEQEDF